MMVMKDMMTFMSKQPAPILSLNVADAKRRFSELLGRVGYGSATVLITRRGRPMAKLVPPGEPASVGGLAEVAGWLDDDDPFFANIDTIVTQRLRHRPRILGKSQRRGSRK